MKKRNFIDCPQYPKFRALMEEPWLWIDVCPLRDAITYAYVCHGENNMFHWLPSHRTVLLSLAHESSSLRQKRSSVFFRLLRSNPSHHLPQAMVSSDDMTDLWLLTGSSVGKVSFCSESDLRWQCACVALNKAKGRTLRRYKGSSDMLCALHSWSLERSRPR